MNSENKKAKRVKGEEAEYNREERKFNITERRRYQKQQAVDYKGRSLSELRL